MLTEFGKQVRKARIDAGVTLQEMANNLKVAPSYLSQVETGRKKVTDSLLADVEKFFSVRGLKLGNLRQAADLSNKSVSLLRMDTEVQNIVTGFARADLTKDDKERLIEMLNKINSRMNKHV